MKCLIYTIKINNQQSTLTFNLKMNTYVLTNPRINKLKKDELKYKKMFHDQEKKNQELQRELDVLKGKIQQLHETHETQELQETQDHKGTQERQETQDPYAVNIIRVSPFRYKHCTYLIDSTNVVHTYGDIYNGIDSKPIGKWDPIHKILYKFKI